MGKSSPQGISETFEKSTEKNPAEVERLFVLLNTEVTYSGKGTGTIISQELNKIKVRFADKESTFILDKKYPMRPRFENDEMAFHDPSKAECSFQCRDHVPRGCFCSIVCAGNVPAFGGILWQ